MKIPGHLHTTAILGSLITIAAAASLTACATNTAKPAKPTDPAKKFVGPAGRSDSQNQFRPPVPN